MFILEERGRGERREGLGDTCLWHETIIENLRQNLMTACDHISLWSENSSDYYSFFFFLKIRYNLDQDHLLEFLPEIIRRVFSDGCLIIKVHRS